MAETAAAPRRPVRLVLLLQDLRFGGTQRQALELAKRLPRDRFAPEMWLMSGGDDFAPLARQAGIPTRFLSTRPDVSPAAVVALWRALRASPPDLLLPLTAVPNIWGRVFGRLLGLPAVVGSCRGGGAPGRQHERLLKNLPHHLVCNSGELRDRLTALGARPDAVTVIPNGVDVDHFAPPPEALRPVRQVALCLARLCPDKDHETLLAAFATVAATRPRAELWIVGDGPLGSKVSLLAARHPAKDRIRLYPGAPDPRPFYQQATLKVLSSVREGLPNVLLEAMAMGLPVAATAVGGVPEAVIEGRTGLLAPPGDPGALAAIMGKLLDDEAMAVKFGMAGRLRAVGAYSLAAMVEGHVRVFDRVLATGRNAARDRHGIPA